MSKAKVTKQGDFLRTVCYHTSTHTRRGSHMVFILTGGSCVSPHWWELTLTSWRDWLMHNGYERGGIGGWTNRYMCTRASYSWEDVWNTGPCQASLFLIGENVSHNSLLLFIHFPLFLKTQQHILTIKASSDRNLLLSWETGALTASVWWEQPQQDFHDPWHNNLS